MTSPITPAEIIRDAEDMVKHYPGDRLRLTGAEVVALVEHVRAESQAQLAAMREALEWAQQNARSLTGGDERRIAKALAPSAGRELLEDVRRLREALCEILWTMEHPQSADAMPLAKRIETARAALARKEGG